MSKVKMVVKGIPAEKPFISGHTEPGYMGATKWVGANCNSWNNSNDLTKAVRELLKKQGVKGVTVRKETYSGGMSLYLTIKAGEEAFVPFDEYVKEYSARDLGRDWIVDSKGAGGQSMSEVFWGATAEEQARLLRENAEHDYYYLYGKERSLNQNYLDDYKQFTPAFREKLEKVKAIVDSFNYDDSNGMVDYFCRSFYETYYVNSKALAKESEVA